MPKEKALAKAHTSAIPDQEVDTPSSHEESTSSDHESESEISFHPSRKQATNLERQQMFMPYIEGPKMDWTVNDSLYHHFLKWKLKCENILECELCCPPRTPTMQETNSLGWELWNGPVCVMGLDKR